MQSIPGHCRKCGAAYVTHVRSGVGVSICEACASKQIVPPPQAMPLYRAARLQAFYDEQHDSDGTVIRTPDDGPEESSADQR